MIEAIESTTTGNESCVTVLFASLLVRSVWRRHRAGRRGVRSHHRHGLGQASIKPDVAEVRTAVSGSAAMAVDALKKFQRQPPARHRSDQEAQARNLSVEGGGLSMTSPTPTPTAWRRCRRQSKRRHAGPRHRDRKTGAPARRDRSHERGGTGKGGRGVDRRRQGRRADARRGRGCNPTSSASARRSWKTPVQRLWKTPCSRPAARPKHWPLCRRQKSSALSPHGRWAGSGRQQWIRPVELVHVDDHGPIRHSPARGNPMKQRRMSSNPSP